MKFIIDTDPGIDDAIAIMLGIKNELDVIGFTLATGNVAPSSSENNLKIIESILNIDTKIYKGSVINQERGYAHFAHGKDGLGDINYPIINKEIEKKYAEDFIIESAINYEDNLTIVCLGPLTNLAQAIKKNPNIVNKINKVVIMGTSYNPNNKEYYDEFNISVDKESAKTVLNSSFKEIRLITHEIGALSYIEKEYMDNLNNSNSEISKFVYKISKKYIEFSKEHNNIIGLSTPDPTTVASIIDESIIRYKPCKIDFVDNKCLVSITDKSNILVSIDFDINRFRKLFKDTFN